MTFIVDADTYDRIMYIWLFESMNGHLNNEWRRYQLNFYLVDFLGQMLHVNFLLI